MKKQTKLEYSDQLADELIARHGLHPSAKKRWKNRGHIPGAYTQEDGLDTSGKVPERDAQYQKIVQILNDPRIAVTKFRTLKQKGSDIALDRSSLTQAEKTGMVTEIVEIRNKCRRAIDVPTEKNLKDAYTDARLHPTHIVPGHVYTKMYYAGPMGKELKETLKLGLIALNNFLKI